ncbi:MAG TPA: protease pro-enzyme activation domain-containing protein [Anaeromyxobacteraceae bacterium]
MRTERSPARRWRTPSLAVALLASALPGAALALPHASRVPTRIDGSQLAAVPGTRHGLATADHDAGAADPATVLRGVELVFAPTAEQASALAELLARQQDAASPDYHRWLSPDEFAERFGLAASDVERVAAWLRSSGFSVDAASRSRTRLSFSGTVAQLASAFHTSFRRYAVGGALHTANATELSIPASLAPVVAAVRNTSDFRWAPRSVAARTVLPEFTSSISGSHFLAPADFATIYDVQPLHAAGIDGSGQRIAIVGQSALATGDVAAFRAAAALPATTVQTVLVPNSGASTTFAGDADEAALDVEWSGAVAPGATIVFVYTGNDPNKGALDALAYAVDQDLAPVISVSYGGCERDAGSSAVLAIQQLARQGNAQGQTIVAASGDVGAADCEPTTSSSATTGLAVDVPASVPEITGVGGSAFDADVTDAAAYWASTNDAGSGSALRYIPERVWNDTAANGTLSASGGGASTIFTKPAWQVGAGVPADGKRDVPDLAIAASPDHDGYLICSQGSCVSGFRASDQTLTVIGGTSVGAPTFAGVLALVLQARAEGGLGNVNPTLYTFAVSTPDAFHRIGSGDNVVPCTTGTTDCPAAAPHQYGFAANGGYSEAAGLGSIDGARLVAAWTSQAASSVALTVTVAGGGTGTVTGGGVSCTAGSSASCSVAVAPGTSLTLTATASAGSTFAGWTGACTGATASCQLTVAAATTVTATFSAASTSQVATAAASSSGGCSDGPGGIAVVLAFAVLAILRRR